MHVHGMQTYNNLCKLTNLIVVFRLGTQAGWYEIDKKIHD